MLRMVLKLILFLALALVVLAAAGLAFLRFWPSVGSLPDRAERAQLERRSAHYAGGTFQNEHEITTMTGSADPSSDRKKPCAMLPAVTPEIDVLFVSHDHYDHLDYRTIRALKDRVGAFVVPLGIDAILRGWGVEAEKIRALDWWESVELGGVTFTLTPAQHFSGRNPLKANSTLWGGMYADNGLHRVYYTGDGGYYEVFSEVRERLGAPELMLAECGQYDSAWAQIHMTPEQTVQAVLDAGAAWLIPVHWGSFCICNHAWDDSIRRVTAAAESAGIQIATPEIGRTVDYDELSDCTQRWWEAYE